MRLTFCELRQIAKHLSISSGHAVVAKIGRKIDIYTDDAMPEDVGPANIIYDYCNGVLRDPIPTSKRELSFLRREAKIFKESLK